MKCVVCLGTRVFIQIVSLSTPSSKRFPSSELLSIRFCRVRHIMRFLALNTGMKVKLNGESKRLNKNNLASN